MSVTINTRGTIHTSFAIGETGLVLTQTGTAQLPEGEDFTVSTSALRGLKVNAEGSAALITTDNSILAIAASELRFNGVTWPDLANGAGKVLTTDGVGGIIWAEYVNSANNASRLSNPRTITLTGDVTGAVTFDGTADVMMATSLAERAALDASDMPDLSADKITSGIFDTARLPDLSSKYVSVTQLGVAGGAATLDANGIIHSYQLPSYVDEVLEYEDLTAFPEHGETGKIYVTLDNNRIYRWSGTLYIEISPTAGNSDTATRLATARTISLSGGITGAATFDGSADISINAIVAPNSVALGTDTTGNYVASLTAGPGITISGEAGAGWEPIITNTSPNISTDISITHSASDVTVNSSDGEGGIINAATASLAGVMTAADKGKLDGLDAVISTSTSVNIHAAAAKTTLADADEFGIADSADSWGLKKVTWANIKSSVSGNFYPKTGGDLSGDINITGTGQRITGDFSNSDTASRLLFSTNVPNGSSYVGVIPNGGASYSALHVYNSSTPSDASTLAVIAADNAVTLASYAVGTGALLPLAIDIGTERARYTTSGGYSLGTTADPGEGSIYITGTITEHFSDERLKTVSGKISNALDKVKQLTGVYYTNNDVAKANGYTSDKTQVGVLAGDVERVLPEVVVPAPFDMDEHGQSKSGAHYRTVQYDKLVPLLIEAIKELSDIVESIKR